jgi:hypothetical protein
MEVKIELSFEQVLKLVNQLPAEDREKLKEEIEKSLSNMKSTKKERTFGLLKGQKFWMSEDFDEPLEEFKDYM